METKSNGNNAEFNQNGFPPRRRRRSERGRAEIKNLNDFASPQTEKDVPTGIADRSEVSFKSAFPPVVSSQTVEHIPPSPNLEEFRELPVKKPAKHRILWVVYGILLICALTVTGMQIYRIAVGKVPSAIPIASLPEEKKENKQLTESAPAQISDSEIVKSVLAAQPVHSDQLEGNENRVTFRTMGGEVLCTISKKLESSPPALLPLPVNEKGESAKGAGVVCASIHNQKAGKEHIGKCSAKDLQLSVIGNWEGNLGLGACVEGRTPLNSDSRENRTDNLSGERMKFRVLGAGQYTKLGDYVCQVQGTKVTCLNVADAKGFEYSDSFGYKFFN